MRVKALRSFLGAEGKVRRSQELDISESRFRQLTEGIHLHNPLVAALDVGYKMTPVPQNKMAPGPAMNKEAPGSSISLRDRRKEAAKGGPADPMLSQQTGGQIGEAKPASSSEPDQAPARRRYRKRGVDPE